MAISTNNPSGLGYQTGYFSGPVGQFVDQSFFNNAFSGQINTNKIYKEAYNCNITMMCNMNTWLEAFTNYETDCHPEYTLLEYNSLRHQVKTDNQVVVPAYPSTVNMTLSAKDHFVGGQYVLPQEGNSLATAPNGILVDITAVTHATGFDTTITLRQRPTGNTSITIPAGSEMLVLEGAILSDCACPTGQFKFRGLPIERDIKMIDFALKGSLCGDAIEKCQWLKIPFLDADGNAIPETGFWYTTAEADMYKDFERRKYYETLLNPTFGIIPTLRALGIKWTPATPGQITVADIRDLKAQLDIYGIAGREYAIFAGRNIYSQFVQMLQTVGVQVLNYQEQPLNDCKWINLEYCGIKVEGLTLHIYDECSFSNGKELGASGMNFPDSAIMVPMGDRPYNPEYSVPSTTRNGYNTKMFTRVYFKSVQGRVYDMFVDSNGFLNGINGRNTFGTGCKQHEWSVESRFANEIHCANSWIYIGL